MSAATLLFDTNILIYHMNNQGGERFFSQFRSALKAGAGISVITRIEVLGWRGHTDDTIAEAASLLDLCMEYSLSESIIQCCIRLRQSYNIKLPDAVIAATALTWKLPVMTRNTEDFKKISGLAYINPFMQ
jgi:predicted nucleic acid-binding protein